LRHALAPVAIAVALAADASGGARMTRLIRSLDAIIVAPQMAVLDDVFR